MIPDDPIETAARAAAEAALSTARAARRDEAKRAPCGCDLSGMAPPAVHIVDRHEDPHHKEAHPMTTDDLTERIARALDKNFNPDRYPIMAAMFKDYAAAVLPIVEAEVRAAKAEAILMDDFDMALADHLADAGYIEYAEDEDGGVTWVSAPLGEILHIVRICATEHEIGNQS